MGSSARMIARVVDQRAGDGDALALPAGKLVRAVVHAVAETDVFERLPGLVAAHGGGEAGVDERQFDVVQAVRTGQEVEGLEDEADLLIADGGEFVVIHGGDVLAR